VDGGGGGSSDTENMAEEDNNSRQQLVPAYKLAEVEKKCADLTNKLRVRQFNITYQRYTEITLARPASL
jgi:hypothetical protein